MTITKKQGSKCFHRPADATEHCISNHGLYIESCSTGIAASLFGMFSVWSTALVAATGIFFALPSFRLYKNLDIQSAKKLMYASFIYLPLVQLVLMIDKLLS